MPGKLSRKNIRNLLTDGMVGFGFGAVIEVTNGAKGGAYIDKVKQVRNSKIFLDNVMKHTKTRVAAGLAYLVSNASPRPQDRINATIHVHKYDDLILLEILQAVAEYEGLGKEHRKRAGLILEKYPSVDLPSYFLRPDESRLKDYSKAIGVKPKNYIHAISMIKGVVMEMYVMHLLDVQLVDKMMFHRIVYDKTDNKTTDADLIVLCPERNFYGAIERLDHDEDITAKVISRKR
ncbi:hypothetical protein ACFL96_15940 [Thermoproteota archaeon]